jgi:hypothetical protein
LPFETIIWVAGVTAEALVLAALWWRRGYRRLPVFFAYVAWGFVSDCTMYALLRRSPEEYLRAYLIQLALDSVWQYAVLVELAQSVLRPFRATLPRGIVIGISLAILLLGAAAWPLAQMQDTAGLSADSITIVRIQFTFAILRVLTFVVLAASSHLLSIGWRNRELQVATGLGFYSLASLAASFVHAHLSPRNSLYHVVDQALAASYLCTLVYWLISFAQKEPARPEFTPRMQGLLDAVAEEARKRREDMTKDPKDRE